MSRRFEDFRFDSVHLAPPRVPSGIPPPARHRADLHSAPWLARRPSWSLCVALFMLRSLCVSGRDRPTNTQTSVVHPSLSRPLSASFIPSSAICGFKLRLTLRPARKRKQTGISGGSGSPSGGRFSIHPPPFWE